MQELFRGIYNNKVVLVTGHTGFKGSWLTLWLEKMGAKVVGLSINVPTDPSHFELLDLDIISIIGDVRDKNKLFSIFQEYKPEIVFHLAAQSLVLHSYKNPAETFDTNIMGTVNVLEACRKSDSVRAVVNITSDKCYENKDWIWCYREGDQLGGYDPYSSSKACAELITNSYRDSFFNLEGYEESHHVLLASARAGNVIGGGDWGENRLIPDIMRSVSRDERVKIRNPDAIRPWQHVLEPLSGYLLLGQGLLEKKKEFAEAWNFGPSDRSSITVLEVVEKMKRAWGRVDFNIETNPNSLHEASLLRLDSSKALMKLKWRNVWGVENAFEKTMNWYKNFYEKGFVLSENDITDYINDAKSMSAEWTM